MSEQIVDGLRVKITATQDAAGRGVDYPVDAVIELSRNVALDLVSRNVAILTNEDEAGVISELMKHLKKRPMGITNAAFALGMDIDECEGLLNRLVKTGRLARTSGSRYSQIYWPAA